ncbi:hypothetical protein DOK78_001844 [Enterococcus sp. DIV2402]|uniref:FAD/NAD(P)-binding domain-containing protein n=1 Tax=Candidatus Enterococcus lowellii TaxID=2230877 RepID=A0ABZ2SN19_9ENTE|nr:NAD(P)/FAD-dependent oxidoreductase [Enterococcus sp. DIV2402]MBO0465880.1 NAD(P)/FAD-dependent oxidoreductase [Enterococcus sp. DIV2402]
MLYDCIIVGGGPAGLSAALVLGRAKLKVLVIDDNNARNKVTHEAHGFITNDRLAPSEIKKRALNDLSYYSTIHTVIDRVETIDEQNQIFNVTTKSQTFTASRLLLATGLKETLPEISGLTNVYGQSFFNCPFCDGWEMKDKSLGVIVEQEEMILHFAAMIFHWSNELTLFTNGLSVNEKIKAKLKAKKITLIEQKIITIEKKNNTCHLSLENGEEKQVAGGFVIPKFNLNISFLREIPLALNEFGRIATDETGKTSYPNIYAAGDSHVAFAEQLVHAASSGSRVASEIVKEIAFANFGSFE